MKHRVSDPREKKLVAANYFLAVEKPWKTARTLGDPTYSFEDFRAEPTVPVSDSGTRTLTDRP